LRDVQVGRFARVSTESGEIRYDDVVAFLMAACPSHADSPDCASVEEGEYVRVLGFVRHLIRLAEEGDTRSFPRVFGVVEWILADGDSAAVDLIRIGFLDDLADASSYEGTHARLADFGLWLGPQARRDRRIQGVLPGDAP
jgi:hypothetical protein